jgi:UDP-N-acetylglucosamine acyltransferase
MSRIIHPTALVAGTAQLGLGVEIGPYCVVGPHVVIGAGTRLLGHVVVDGHTRLGERGTVFPGACLGLPPQSKKHLPQSSLLVVGHENVIREHVTINAGLTDGAPTVVGDRNFLMVGAHIGHDCVVGSDTTLANQVALGGHVVVEDQAVIGGLTGVHQFSRIGKFAMVGGLSKVVMDVLPFSLCDGHPARPYGVNSIGLRRNGYTSKEIMVLKKALKKIFFSKDLVLTSAEVKKESGGDPHVEHLLRFIETSKRGIARSFFHDPAED